MPIRCEIVTQDKLLFEGPADVVIAPGSEGRMAILPHHTPLLATLDYGVLQVRYEGREELFAIAGGVIEVRPDIVIVLANVGENIDEIDVARAEAAKARAVDLLKRAPAQTTEEYLAVEAALRRSKLRLDAVRRYRRVGRQRLRIKSDKDT